VLKVAPCADFPFPEALRILGFNPTALVSITPGSISAVFKWILDDRTDHSCEIKFYLIDVAPAPVFAGFD
jgi:hypothetical protein